MLASSPYRVLFVYSLLFLVGLGTASQGQNDPHVDYKLKHLATFAGYTTWPNTTRTVFIIGVVDSKEFFHAAAAFYKGRTIKDKPVELRFFPATSPDFECDLLYVPKATLGTERITAIIKQKPILSVGDALTNSEVLINFLTQDGEIAYEMNPNAFNQAKLEVDYYFLKTSRIVK